MRVLRKFSEDSRPLIENLSSRTPPERKRKSKLPSRSSPQLEGWKNKLQTHEQVSIGQPRGTSEAKMKAFLDEIEKKIDGKKNRSA